VTLLYQTKFFPPPIPSWFVVRPSLIEKLDGVLTHALTLVSAPAGSGKTTLVSDWVKSIRKRKEISIAWLSLDSADNSVDSFLDYLIGCLEESGVSIELPQEQTLENDQTVLAKNITGLIHSIKNVHNEIILILDDYHQIQNQDIHAIISNLLFYPSKFFHLVIITRSDPPFELARMRMAGQLSEIRMENLRFSDADAAKFIHNMLKFRLAEKDLEILNSRTEGWIAGLQLAAISLRNREDASSFVTSFAGSHRFIFDYLLEQVLNEQSQEVKTFLLKTSILDRFSNKLCDSVTESNASQKILDILERENLFLIPLDDERGWFRYHHLFADLLKRLLDQTFPGLVGELHRKASTWFENQGMIADAIDHALAAGDMELTTRLVSENVLALVEYSELSPILHRIDMIPLEKRKSSAWLNIAFAWILAYSGQIERSESTLRDVEDNIFRFSSYELRRIHGHIKVVRGYLAWVAGRQSDALELSQTADKILPQNEISVRALNLVVMGNTLSQFNPSLRSVEILRRAFRLAREIRKPHVFMLASSGLAYALIILGRLDEAKEVCDEAMVVSEQFRQMTGQPLYSNAVIYAELSRIHYEWGENQVAIQYARKGTMLANRWAQSDSIVVCLLNEINALISINEMKEANSLLQRARKSASKVSPWFVVNVEQFEIIYWLEKGEPKNAALILKNAAGAIPTTLHARVLLAQNNLVEAFDLLEKEVSDEDNQSAIENCRKHQLLSLIWLKKNNTEKALDQIKKSLEIAQENNFIQLFMNRIAGLEELLRLALQKRIYPGFTQKLLSLYSSSPHKIKIPKDEELIEPFSDRELEILSLLNSPYSTPEIAEQLFISANTVRTHIKNIYGKLNAHGRTEAVKRAKRLKLI
jgi:LuxR family maltose regulon positive regulatory protein